MAVNVLREESANVPTALEREVERPEERVGVSGSARSRSKLFHYDRDRGLSTATFVIAATKSDRMSDEAAAAKMKAIHENFKIENQEEGFFYDFHYALFVCYALNGASQLLEQDRVFFYVGISHYDYYEVMTVLGVEARRFFRTYANEVVDACKRLYYRFNPNDEQQVHLRNLMIQLAAQRGVSRAPWLIADCVEAATNIDAYEVSLAEVSKTMVIGSTTNAVDRRRRGGPIISLDKYDSSTGTVIPGAGATGGGPTGDSLIYD